MAGNFSFLYPDKYDKEQSVSMKDYKFIRSLQIDEMVILIKESYRGFADLELKNFYSTDPEVLRYRLAVVTDLVENDTLYQLFSRAVTLIFNISMLRKTLASDFTVDAALSSVRFLETYQEIVDLFTETLQGMELRSESMQSFRRMVLDIAESEEYQNLKKELAQMEVNFGYLKSVTIGVNLDENLRPKEAGILSINEKPFKSGNIMDRLLGKKLDGETLISPLFPVVRGMRRDDLNALNRCISSGLHTIFAKSLRDFEPIIQNYYHINTTLFVSLLDEIRFLTAGVGFIRSMKAKGFPMCCPKVADVSEKRCELEDVYNPGLAKRTIEKTIVSNSFTYDEKGRFYLVTGPNHGGKSIFAYSVGMAQALFQLGLFVPAKRAYMSPVTGIFTHFPSSDEDNYGKGRLESECARLGEIMKQLSDTDMLLMDESFSSTSGLEASYIATEVITGIGVIGCGGIFVTHIHDLPQKIEIYNSHPANRGRIDNLVALMENKESGTRSYKISRTTPDGLSYARDIANQYGLDLEGILGDRDVLQ